MSIDVPNFRILHKIGSGQGSTLYKAKSISTGDLYAIKHVKVLSPEHMRLIDQMRDEHACGSQLDHPVLRKTFEMRYVRRRLRIKAGLLFMEFVEGETLWIAHERLSLPALINVFEQAAEGLGAMHKGGFVHADVKPGNIMVMADGNVKLIDFGQSAPINQAKPRIQGTPDYMAPEQASKQRLDARTDIFGLGAAFYRILTGQAMTTDMNQNLDMGLLRVGMRRRDQEGTSLDEYPPVLRKLIEDSCQQDPALRPPDAKAFVERCRMARLIIAKRAEFDEAATSPEQSHDS